MAALGDRVFSLTGEPSLYRFEAAYNVSAAYYIAPQLQNLCEFCRLDTNERSTVAQIDETARLIAATYPYLRVTELLLFFARFKSGRYGRFYGRLDPLSIMQALASFVCERAEAIDQAIRAQARAEAAHAQARAVTYAEYKKLTTNPTNPTN